MAVRGRRHGGRRAVRRVTGTLGNTGTTAPIIPALAPSSSSTRAVLLLLLMMMMLLLLLLLLRMSQAHAQALRPVW
jgi:hypothetical protein